VKELASTLTTSNLTMSANGCISNSSAQLNPVGMLALTKKSRTGILALISTLSGERVDAPIFAGRSAPTLTIGMVTQGADG
jgi:hypothetical protein